MFKKELEEMLRMEMGQPSNNEVILIAAVQKFYSALRDLDKIKEFDQFESTSILDTYFQEYRNITFVIQKRINAEDKQIYEKLRDNYLVTQSSKELISIRNSVTKEEPINYYYKIKFLHYIFNQCKTSIYQFDKFEFNQETIDEVIKIKLKDCMNENQFFSLEIELYYDDINLLDLVSEANIVMLKFIKNLAIELNVCFNSNTLKTLLEKCEKLIIDMNAQKELLYKLDYEFSNGVVMRSDKVFIKYGETIEKLPYLYDSPIFKESFNDKLLKEKKLFLSFISMHVLTFKLQDNNLMPTFLIVYSDYTFEFKSIISNSKSSIKHKLQDIKNQIKEKNVILVISVIEVYIHKPLRVTVVEDYITQESLLFNYVDKLKILEYTLGESSSITELKNKENHILKELFDTQNYLVEI